MNEDEMSTAQPTGLSPALRAQVTDYGIIEHIGEFTLDDGRKVFGALMSFVGEPPPIKLADIWNRTPFLLKHAAAADEPCSEGVTPNPPEVS